MSNKADEALRAAEKAELDALRNYYAEMVSAPDELVVAAQEAVAALQSPLPSREYFVMWDGHWLDSDSQPGVGGEHEWASCLRWVVENPSVDLLKAADELEARS